MPSGSCDNLLRNVEGIWSLLKRAMANFAAADPDGPVRIVKRKLKTIQYRPRLIDGRLAAAWPSSPGNNMLYRFNLVSTSPITTACNICYSSYRYHVSRMSNSRRMTWRTFRPTASRSR